MPANTPRRVVQSPIGQGQHERIAYTCDFTKWSRTGNIPSNPAVTIIDLSTGTDVSASKLSGAPSINQMVMTTPLVILLVPDIQYRLNMQCVIDGNTFEAYCVIIGEE
jgi:hypothetical protein